jgi:hypothetical protein
MLMQVGKAMLVTFNRYAGCRIRGTTRLIRDFAKDNSLTQQTLAQIFRYVKQVISVAHFAFVETSFNKLCLVSTTDINCRRMLRGV